MPIIRPEEEAIKRLLIYHPRRVGARRGGVTPSPTPTPLPTFPSWETNGDTATQYFSAFADLASSSTFDYTQRTNLTIGTSIQSYVGSVTAENGKIYAIPFNYTYIQVIDPSDNSVTQGSAYLGGSSKWTGGVLAPNGNIYAIPHSSTQIMKIDTSTDNVSLFGSIVGSSKYWGGVLGQNGMVYGIPRNSTTILKLDPTTETISQFGTLSSTTNKWRGGVLAKNGKIYCAPSSATDVLVIDPSDDSYYTIASSSSGYIGINAAVDGNLYCIDGTKILKIEPDTDTITTIPITSTISNTFDTQTIHTGDILGIDNNIGSGTILFDYDTQSLSVNGTYTGSVDIGGGSLSFDGRVFFVPFNGGNGYVIGAGGETLNPDFVLGRYINKF